MVVADVSKILYQLWTAYIQTSSHGQKINIFKPLIFIFLLQAPEPIPINTLVHGFCYFLYVEISHKLFKNFKMIAENTGKQKQFYHMSVASLVRLDWLKGTNGCTMSFLLFIKSLLSRISFHFQVYKRNHSKVVFSSTITSSMVLNTVERKTVFLSA